MHQLRERKTLKFKRAEIQQMENLHKEVGEESLDRNFCDKLARKFSRAVGRSGKPAIQWDQVQRWFQKKQQACKTEAATSIAPRDLVALTNKQTVVPSRKNVTPPNTSISNNAAENSSTPKGENLPDISDLEFEAISSKDGAWYDVSLFLAHRVLSSGEPFVSSGMSTGQLPLGFKEEFKFLQEVRVRFVGFGPEEDEWVNVKKGVRERSVPLESSECQDLNVGNLVLCFQERRDQAIYYDAHVVEIQRKLHDIRGCRCLFLVRYDHDNAEERVHLRRLCRRPSY
ncbi:hypothetical protein IFM89_022611 [Coptis chinensis]|uniref:SAWADEE domain-containing protein n=1 Tax=Coptis chinensis TaxID=261450 RepID=A0A835IDT6_9MAGN|nr:hypothetical protein IFM89_022611 [Coptis chinensis]